MKLITKDDRTEEQKQTHIWGVVAQDKFMSGWGGYGILSPEINGGTSKHN